MRKPVGLLIFCFLAIHSGWSQNDAMGTKRIQIEPGEKWYGAAVTEADKMPFQDGYSYDLRGNTGGNQAAPLLLSTHGRFIWSDQAFSFQLSGGALIISGATGSIDVEKKGSTLSDAFRGASSTYFPASGKMPDDALFIHPQYNTWIELVYNQNQTDILKYAHAIIGTDKDAKKPIAVNEHSASLRRTIYDNLEAAEA